VCLVALSGGVRTPVVGRASWEAIDSDFGPPGAGPRCREGGQIEDFGEKFANVRGSGLKGGRSGGGRPSDFPLLSNAPLRLA